jgi:hypothetical protein
MRVHYLLSTVVLLVALSLGGCDDQSTGASASDESLSKGRGLGVCFMGGQSCMDVYVDNGEYKEIERIDDLGKNAAGVPVYVFPSVPASQGGRPHPLDPNKRYRPFRLQNNVFAGPGREWEMWLVKSGTLNLMAQPSDSVILWGVGADQTATADDDPKGSSVRDLFTRPFTSESDILTFASRGLLRIENTEMIVDCPLATPSPVDEVINLNPGYEICER